MVCRIDTISAISGGKVMPEAEGCITCALLAARDAGTRPLWDCIYRTPFWDVVHAFNTALPGWLVLVARRHVASVAELTSEEAIALGLAIRRVSQALISVTHCTKTYVIQFAEASGHGHGHVHIVPRMPNLPADRRGPQIFSYLGVAEHERLSDAAMDVIAQPIRAYLRESETGSATGTP
jgi:diadenosine tetraphosphate (Ap4A) HIT family hydrolase